MDFRRIFGVLIIGIVASVGLFLLHYVFVEINDIRNETVYNTTQDSDYGQDKTVYDTTLDSDYGQDKTVYDTTLDSDYGQGNLSQKIELQRLTQISKKTGCTIINGRCFTLDLGDKKDWFKARNFCHRKGGYMPEFPDQDFNLLDIYETFLKGMKAVFWVDCTDQIEEGKWVWTSGKILSLGDPRWRNGSPDNYRGYEHHLFLDYYPSYGKIIREFGDWDSYSKAHAICEY